MKLVGRTLLWIIAIAVALPLLPLAMSLCAGIYVVADSADSGNRSTLIGSVGGALSLVTSVVGIAVMATGVYLLLRG